MSLSFNKDGCSASAEESTSSDRNARKPLLSSSASGAVAKGHHCDICDKLYTSKYNLRRHIRQVHEMDQTKAHSCGTCQKAFKTAYELGTHRRIHENLRPFECQDCHHKFRQKSHLKAHTRRHTGEQPFSCRLCHKRFKQSSTLRVHLQRHSATMYPCALCGTQFPTQAEALRHRTRVNCCTPYVFAQRHKRNLERRLAAYRYDSGAEATHRAYGARQSARMASIYGRQLCAQMKESILQRQTQWFCGQTQSPTLEASDIGSVVSQPKVAERSTSAMPPLIPGSRSASMAVECTPQLAKNWETLDESEIAAFSAGFGKDLSKKRV